MSGRRIALVTGGSSGIGLETARLLAADRYDLVLVARGQGRLEAAARDIATSSGARVLTRPADLSEPGAGGELVRRLPGEWSRIDLLVNNAAFGTYGPFADTPLDESLRMMRVNMESLVELTGLLLPAMLASGSGRILNIASVAAYTPGPLMSVYYATKAFVLSFSEAIARELSGSGVTVTAFCPGPVRTAFQERAGIGPHRFSGIFAPMSAERAARIGYRAMRRGKRTEAAGLGNRLLVLFIRAAPRRLVTDLVFLAQSGRKR